jgi:isopentenyldiphosphate isomerase
MTIVVYVPLHPRRETRATTTFPQQKRRARIKSLTFAPVSKTNRMNNEEIFPLVDECGKTVGHAPRSLCHNGSMLLHPVVHLYIFDRRGNLYLQKRAANKDLQPGLWDISVGGHIGPDESPEEALHREAREELGISNFSYRKVWEHVYQNNFERQYAHCFVTVYDGALAPNPDELEDGGFRTIDEIRRAFGTGIFTADLETELPIILQQ